MGGGYPGQARLPAERDHPFESADDALAAPRGAGEALLVDAVPVVAVLQPDPAGVRGEGADVLGRDPLLGEQILRGVDLVGTDRDEQAPVAPGLAELEGVH